MALKPNSLTFFSRSYSASLVQYEMSLKRLPSGSSGCLTLSQPAGSGRILGIPARSIPDSRGDRFELELSFQRVACAFNDLTASWFDKHRHETPQTDTFSAHPLHTLFKPLRPSFPHSRIIPWIRLSGDFYPVSRFSNPASHAPAGCARVYRVVPLAISQNPPLAGPAEIPRDFLIFCPVAGPVRFWLERP